MTTSAEIIGRLERRLRERRPTGLTSVRLALKVPPGEIDWLASLPMAGGTPRDECFYWNRPSEGLTLVAHGGVRHIETSGPERFEDASQAVTQLLASIESLGDEGPPSSGPLALGGLAFGDDAAGGDPHWEAFPAARFALPEILFVRRHRSLWVTLVCDGRSEVSASARDTLAALFDGAPNPRSSGGDSRFDCEGPGGMTLGPEYRVRSDRSHADYRAQVEAARRAIGEGELSKVVLARSLQVQHDGRFDLRALLNRLAQLYPTCVTFAISRPGACFLGSTPELLVARVGERVTSGAVAGSARRGHTPEEDGALGRALREDKKEQAEHAIVVDAIRQALVLVCETLDVPEAPRLLRIEGIQHLETPIEGTLRTGSRPSVLSLAGRLHPTPAVGGAPRTPALDWIRRSEGLDRGWYAGPVGFIDGDGGGEFRVALRSALIRSGASSDEAMLFAGGGIVADSQPDRELEETRLKLRALLAPLTEI